MGNLVMYQSLSREEYYNIKFKTKDNSNHSYHIHLMGDGVDKHLNLNTVDSILQIRYAKNMNSEGNIYRLSIYENDELVYFRHIFLKLQLIEATIKTAANEINKQEVKKEQPLKLESKNLGNFSITEEELFDEMCELFNIDLEEM